MQTFLTLWLHFYSYIYFLAPFHFFLLTKQSLLTRHTVCNIRSEYSIPGSLTWCTEGILYNGIDLFLYKQPQAFLDGNHYLDNGLENIWMCSVNSTFVRHRCNWQAGLLTPISHWTVSWNNYSNKSQVNYWEADSTRSARKPKMI